MRTGLHPGFFQGLKQVFRLPLGTVRRGGKTRHVRDTLAWSATGVRLRVNMESKAPRRKRNLSLLHKQVRTPGPELVWVGLVDSHMEAELLE